MRTIKQKSIKTIREKLSEQFEVKTVCRSDVMDNMRLTEKQVLRLTDDDMKSIANLMSDLIQDCYWDCLDSAFTECISGRENEFNTRKQK